MTPWTVISLGYHIVSGLVSLLCLTYKKGQMSSKDVITDNCGIS